LEKAKLEEIIERYGSEGPKRPKLAALLPEYAIEPLAGETDDVVGVVGNTEEGNVVSIAAGTDHE
jgi:hypothetical protein